MVCSRSIYAAHSLAPALDRLVNALSRIWVMVRIGRLDDPGRRAEVSRNVEERDPGLGRPCDRCVTQDMRRDTVAPSLFIGPAERLRYAEDRKALVLDDGRLRRSYALPAPQVG